MRNYSILNPSTATRPRSAANPKDDASSSEANVHTSPRRGRLILIYTSLVLLGYVSVWILPFFLVDGALVILGDNGLASYPESWSTTQIIATAGLIGSSLMPMSNAFVGSASRRLDRQRSWSLDLILVIVFPVFLATAIRFYYVNAESAGASTLPASVYPLFLLALSAYAVAHFFLSQYRFRQLVRARARIRTALP